MTSSFNVYYFFHKNRKQLQSQKNLKLETDAWFVLREMKQERSLKELKNFKLRRKENIMETSLKFIAPTRTSLDGVRVSQETDNLTTKNNPNDVMDL